MRDWFDWEQRDEDWECPGWVWPLLFVLNIVIWGALYFMDGDVSMDMDGPGEPPGLDAEYIPASDEDMREIANRQELVIQVLRNRVFELEMELINARCAVIDHPH